MKKIILVLFSVLILIFTTINFALPPPPDSPEFPDLPPDPAPPGSQEFPDLPPDPAPPDSGSSDSSQSQGQDSSSGDSGSYSSSGSSSSRSSSRRPDSSGQVIVSDLPPLPPTPTPPFVGRAAEIPNLLDVEEPEERLEHQTKDKDLSLSKFFWDITPNIILKIAIALMFIGIIIFYLKMMKMKKLKS